MVDFLKEEVYNYNGISLVAPFGFSYLKANDPVEFSYICNGCGAGSALIDLVPDNILQLNIKICCNIHDFSQNFCPGTHEEFERQNRVFRNNLFRVITKQTDSIYLKRARLYLGNKYYKAVNTFGATVFWDLKNESDNKMLAKGIDGEDQYSV